MRFAAFGLILVLGCAHTLARDAGSGIAWASGSVVTVTTPIAVRVGMAALGETLGRELNSPTRAGDIRLVLQGGREIGEADRAASVSVWHAPCKGVTRHPREAEVLAGS